MYVGESCWGVRAETQYSVSVLGRRERLPLGILKGRTDVFSITVLVSSDVRDRISPALHFVVGNCVVGSHQSQVLVVFSVCALRGRPALETYVGL